MAKRNLILYHDSCLDGFVAGMLAQTKAIYDGLPNIRMIPVNYGNEKVVAFSGDNMIIVDFSYDPDVIDAYRKNGVNVTIADHHETQIDKINKANFGKHEDKLAYNISYSCDCKDKDSSFFTKLIPSQEPKFGEWHCYLSDNRDTGSMKKESGASLVFSLLGMDDDFYNFMVNSLTYRRNDKLISRNYEINQLIHLVRTHDLWLHNGSLTHDATYLSAWFKAFNRKFEQKRLQMVEKPEKSFEIFSEIKAHFMMTDIFQKLAEGKVLIEKDIERSHAACRKVRNAEFLIDTGVNLEGINIGFIAEDSKNFNISMTGSILVKDYHKDVAVMIAVETSDTITLSLRSNNLKKNVDIGLLCSNLKEKGYAISGGGHRNAAGVTLKKDRINEVFTYNPSSSTQITQFTITHG